MRKIIYLIIFVYLFISYATYAQPAKQNAVSALDKAFTEAKQGGYTLITPEELQREYLKNPESLFLIDTRQDWAYQMQHIKGAVHLPVTPTWWYQYSPGARSDIKKVLGDDKNKKAIFY